MKEVIVSPAESEINALLESVREEETLLRTVDGRVFLLTALDDFEQEIVRTRQNKKLMALLDERRKEKATIPWQEVKRELDLE